MNAAVLSESPRIYIVEDEGIVALDLSDNLSSLGFDVAGVAASESDALRGVDATRPDMVLMDINLGRGGDGIRAAQQIRERFGIPVIYLTAYAEPETLSRAGATTPYGYLLKPFEMRELNATLRMALAKHAEDRAIARGQQRLRLALDAANLGVMEYFPDSQLVELDGHYQPLAEQQARGFCLPRDEFLAHLDEVSRDKLRALLTPGAAIHCVAQWRGEDGSALWLEIHACHFDAERKVVGVFRDVTAKVRSDTLLRQAAVVFESAADAILILDAQGLVISANPAFESMTGWPCAEVIGRRPGDFLYARRRDDRHELALPAHQLTDWSGEVTCRRKDLGSFPAWEHIAPVVNETGQLTHRVLSFSDISALRRAERHIHHLAFHDPLTGLGNRNYLDQCLQELQASQEEQSSPYGVLFIDLDGFKLINDTLGHAMGDELLIALARRLVASLRSSDIAIRLGGDEFVVLVRQAREEDFYHLAEKLLAIFRLPVTIGSAERIQVSASIGIAMLPQHVMDGAALIKAADSAMYAAKAGGRNRYEVFTDSLAVQSERRLRIEQGLRRALGSPQLSVHWQPVVDLRDGRLLAAEALVRWDSPELGRVAPDEFIAVAEDSGVIQDLGRWIITEALNQFAAWRAAGVAPPCIAVNVSARQFKDNELQPLLASLLQSLQLPAEAVEIELTESTLQSVESSQGRMTALRELGLRLALDDFGTGFSSLSMLRHLPLTRVKIDKSFVQGLGEHDSDQAVVRAIMALAASLQLEVTAEGVETEAQREHLLALGVQACQGWLYARAMPAMEFQAWTAGRDTPTTPE